MSFVTKYVNEQCDKKLNSVLKDGNETNIAVVPSAAQKNKASDKPPQKQSELTKKTDKNCVKVSKPKNIVTGSYSSKSFGGPKQQLWLHVFRCNKGTTEDKITAHLNRRIPKHNFTVQKLASRGVYSSFCVNADFDESLLSILYEPQFWPAGVKVKRFQFFRKISEESAGFQ